jgi:hypothetical protein
MLDRVLGFMLVRAARQILYNQGPQQVARHFCVTRRVGIAAAMKLSVDGECKK